MRPPRYLQAPLPFHRPSGWLGALRTYLVITLISHLTWEIIQLPLYTIWSTASPRELAFAVLHCTAGDLLIALATLMGSLALIGDRDWPFRGRLRVAGPTVFGGLIYTIFSEWFNTGIKGTWAYSDLMPTLPLIGTGLSPLLQWVLIPTLALAAMGRISQDGPDAVPSPGR
jgi:hypothetical protein